MSAVAHIDGRKIEVRPGMTVLEGARQLGIPVPSLCASPGLVPEGSCRLCLVETSAEGPVEAACHTVLSAGMQIQTKTPRLMTMRRELLHWIADATPAAARNPRADGNEFERLLHEFGVEARDARPRGDDEHHPYLRVDDSLCIACARCVHACDEIQGQQVLALSRREAPTRLLIGARDGFVDSDCTACGACAETCPTDAISDLDLRDAAPAERSVSSTCAYCGVGCQVTIESAKEVVLRIAGRRDAAVNRGHLCAKGRYAHAYHRSPERLTKPLLRKGDDFHEVPWDEAIGWLARRLNSLRVAHGPDALGALTSSRSTNEAAYLLQKLMRLQIGTNNVDCCARVCHSSTALALRQVTGTGAASASYADIETARCIVVAGANPTEAHPVVGARLRRRVREGSPLVVIDPRRIELAQLADVHLALHPGTNVALMNGLAKLLIEKYGFDESYAADRLDGLGELREFLADFSLAECCQITGVPEIDLQRGAEVMAEGPALFVHGLGLSELTQGTGSVKALCNLGMLTGSIGLPGAGMLPLRGQNNVQGNADMGAMPALFTGYQPLGDPSACARVEEIWGGPIPQTAGLTLPEMIDAAGEGQIRGLWIQGEDLVQSEPGESHTREALSQLELLVVQELFLSETARMAHLVLPAAGALEQEGTFTNGERRIQRVRAAVAPPGEARPDWEVIRDIATAMGSETEYASPSDVMDEVSRVAPRLFGGVAYPRLEGDGIQWPCPSPEHPGTATVHTAGFLRGKGQLSVLRHVPSPEHGIPEYPLTLITGRVLQQYNVGSMTRRTPSHALASEDLLEVTAHDAEALGLEDSSLARLESQWGRTIARVRLSERVSPGTVFLSFHHPETHANAVTGPQRDPESNCPEYKVTAVRIEPQPA